MTDNPFDDLGTVSDDDSPSDSNDSAGETPTTDEPTTASATDADESVTSSAEPERDATDAADESSGPAFEYSEVRQRPLYARGETWDEFEDAVGITVVPELRKAGIRDEEKREIHDAVLRLAAQEPDRIAELIKSER
ncbi:hypothetical protein ACFOZ7_12255 [Natribaculum luteum]|uniref:Uncharacterized protein n=1 Tax=Natribaculum luteum TaxID=1586232 RepID=A0ABD5P0B4_9EURY|nr:hypothetical protein [Natribaculum luteum]